jgi:hypothetical protein
MTRVLDFEEFEREIFESVTEGDDHLRKMVAKKMPEEVDEFSLAGQFHSDIFEISAYNKSGLDAYKACMNRILSNADTMRLNGEPKQFWKQSGELVIYVEWYEFIDEDAARAAQGTEVTASPDDEYM